jgi:hypothetical protein
MMERDLARALVDLPLTVIPEEVSSQNPEEALVRGMKVTEPAGIQGGHP